MTRKIGVAICLAAIMLSFTGCGIFKETWKRDPEILIKNGFVKALPIAVVSFQRAGSSEGGAGIGIYAADRLSEKMFLSDSFSVVDRSRVNEAIKFFEVRNTDALSLDDIQRIGLRLKAGYLVAGTVRITGGGYLKENNKKTVQLSIRIISVLNSDVLGAVNISAEYGDDPKDTLDEMIKTIVDRLSKI